ncbi:MAG: 4-amino-4-deoxy-L-arabinose transferase [Bacillota bacterium]
MKKTNSIFNISRYNLPYKGCKTQDLILGIYIFCYFLVSLSFLTECPFVHSDESWLSGLTRNMMEEGDFGVTETFYDLKPRYPHGIKIIFHLLQMPMLALFQYNVFAFRLLSLTFGSITLIVFYLLLKSIFAETDSGRLWGYPLIGTIFLSVDIQFVYASHFARQEIILVCCIAACMLALIKKHYLIAGLITGLSIGLHPNSLLIGTMCGAMLLPIGSKQIKRLKEWKPLLGYAGITSVFAVVFISISLTFDRKFFKHYLEYGNSEFDIGAPVTNKLMELPYFFKKIWYGVSGTYYVPDVRFELVLFALTGAVISILLLSGKIKYKTETVLMGKGIIGMIAGMVMIGRYNQTSIVFLFPLLYIVILLALDNISDGCSKTKSIVKHASVIMLIIITASSSWFNIAPWLNYRYEDYINEISKAVEPQNKVLANLNSEYYFDNGKLLDYRNLSYLKDANMSIEDYIRKNKIEYIILSDEMDLIYSQRPVWNIIYGNLRYMDELHQFLDEKCTLVHRFQNNTYGVRMVQYMNSDRDFTVQIFKVKDLS